MKTIEKWGAFELKLKGKSDGNPFTDYKIKGCFQSELESKTVDGFYNGDDEYIIRFMPSFIGKYEYEISGNFSDEKTKGFFEVIDASSNNHGIVRTSGFHFTYDDGKPYYPIGTTCYAWTHQKQTQQQQTLESLKNSPFNKIRFCIFPKHYDYNLYEPATYPYEGKACDITDLTKENFESFLPQNSDNSWDFKRFIPEHFQTLEERIKDLQKLGIEADLILFHPYDRWGFSCMSKEDNEFYLNYVIARFAAFRNVWWSLANEYDLCQHKNIEDWEHIASVICQKDPYGHLRSIHNCKPFYDYTRPWITHCSIQRNEIYLSAANTIKWREQYGKPIVIDEAGYEGDINWSWGNLTGQELIRLFWTALVRGGYCGHGETFVNPQNVLWWSHGGRLNGESSPRIAFMLKILEEVPGLGLEPANIRRWEDNSATAAHPGFKNKYYLFYTGRTRPSFRSFEFPAEKNYQVEVIDTWDMTIENRGVHSGCFTIDLPAKEFIAIRIIEVDK